MILLFAWALPHIAHASSPGLPPPPLGIPLPTQPTLSDVLSTSTGSGDGSGPLPGARTCNSAQAQPITFPADDGPHVGATLEWWFWNGHLTTPNGHRWAFIVYFESRGALGVQGVDSTLLDVTSGKFHYGRQPLILGAPAASPHGFSLHADHASAVGGNGTDVVTLDLDGYRLNVKMQATKPPALMFGNGFVTFYCQSSYYYARTRMAVTGTLIGPGVNAHVNGHGWFDHQWGFLPALLAVRWQYVQLQLDDGRDIFLGHMTLPTGGSGPHIDLGIISDRHGNVTTLHHGDFTITPTGSWKRDATCSYPVDLAITVKGQHFNIRPSIQNSELRATKSLAAYALWPEYPNYWDGETTISGDATGRGWLDLAKYCAV